MTSSKLVSDRVLLRRCRLMDAARGILNQDHPHRAGHGHHQHHPLPTFSLQRHHVNTSFSTPHDFHTALCDAIQNAKKRVYIASLYVGPAADPIKQPKEVDFLKALQNSSAPDIKIILDENRALRPVPITADHANKKQNKTNATTSSAKATSQAIINSQCGKIHLFQVLPSPLSSLLPNPLNEVAGVFHIKIYIIDDMLILSGANLSEEYFVDRQDRYFTVQNGGNGLVDFYGEVVNVLCNHAATYHDDNDDETGVGGKSSSESSSKASQLTSTTTSRQEFWKQINQLFQDKNPKSSKELFSDPDTVAICIPTFHVPKGFWSSEDTVTTSVSTSSFVTDVDATLGILGEGAEDSTSSVYLSSAYLNPTEDLITCLKEYNKIDMITAGRLSHGFKNPSNQNEQQSNSNKAGNVGKAWIPTVFDHLQSDAYHKLEDGSTTTNKTTIWHWERPDWTFHAKGIWLQTPLFTEPSKTSTKNMITEAAIVGSSNFGGRSFLRDMESNLIMVFPPPLSDDVSRSSTSSIVAERLQDEWRAMVAHSKPINVKDLLASAPPLPIHIRSLLPYIKSFF